MKKPIPNHCFGISTLNVAEADPARVAIQVQFGDGGARPRLRASRTGTRRPRRRRSARFKECRTLTSELAVRLATDQFAILDAARRRLPGWLFRPAGLLDPPSEWLGCSPYSTRPKYREARKDGALRMNCRYQDRPREFGQTLSTPRYVSGVFLLCARHIVPQKV
jgi:hypothetical protein